ncbi:MAG: IreB family regulatory phosphoprotein [Oscillospiraceae bacterium]|nr:IreB family regulatory phosphoprotein [Oscillospiraceae bacterium]
MFDPTMTFSLAQRKDEEIRAVISVVFEALKEKGYNPVNQIVGYILSEDPTYITTHNNARSQMSRLDRDDILQAMVKHFVSEDI